MQSKIVALAFWCNHTTVLSTVYLNHHTQHLLTWASLCHPGLERCPQLSAPRRCVRMGRNVLHIHRDKTINQLWKSIHGAHACTVRNWNAQRSRTHRTRPLRLGSSCSFKNPNPRPMIYQTLIIKKMSGEGHLALHWRKLLSFPRSYRSFAPSRSASVLSAAFSRAPQTW